MADHTTKPSRLWRTVLVCSLALNLAIAGVVGGAFVSGRFADGPPRSFDLGLGPVARALSPQERRDVGRSLRQDRSLRGVNLRATADAMIVALKAEPFDQAGFLSLLEQQATRAATLQDRARAAFVAQIADMSPQRRAVFADQLREELSKERPRRARNNSGG